MTKALAARLREMVADAPEPAEITFDLQDANDITDLREIISALEGVEEMREALTEAIDVFEIEVPQGDGTIAKMRAALKATP